MYKTKFINLKSVIVFVVLAFAMVAFAISALFVQSNAQEQNGTSANIAQEQNGFTIDVEFSYQQGYVTSTRQNLPYIEENNKIFVYENTLYLGHNQLIAKAAEGYSFVGWYLDGQRLDEETHYLTSDATFYAKFASSELKLQFNATADSPEDCEVRPGELTISCGSSFYVREDTLEFNNGKRTERVKADVRYEDHEQFDYWLMDGVKINNKDSGVVYEGHVFSAHFSYKATTEVTGTVKDIKGDPCPYATVCSKIDSSEKIDNIVHADAEGNYKIPLLTHPKEKINLFAANDDGTGQATILYSTTQTDIEVRSDSSFNIISGVVKAHGATANENIPLAQADVMFQFSGVTSTYLYTTTNANGEYAFIIPNQDHDSGVLVCNPARYIIDGSKIEGIEGTAKLLEYDYEMWQGDNIQIRYIHSQAYMRDWYETKLEISDGEDKVEFIAKVQEDLNISLPSGNTNVKVDGDTITLHSYFDNLSDGTNYVNYQVVPHFDEGELFTNWKCNGVIMDDHSDFTLTESLDFEPVVAELITISGLVCSSADSNDPQAGEPLDGVTVVFLNKEDYVISQTVSSGEDGKNFTLTKVPAGSFGNILFIKEGKEPSEVSITQDQTQDIFVISSPVNLDDGEADARYIIGRITDSKSPTSEVIPVAGARISFTYGKTYDYINTVSNADGSYLIKIEDPEVHEGSFSLFAHGYKSKFIEHFNLGSIFVTASNLTLEKFEADKFCDVSFSTNPNVQKFQLYISNNWLGYRSVFDIPSNFSISVDKDVFKLENNENVLHVQEDAPYRSKNDFYISAIPTELYKVNSWDIKPMPETTIGQNTSCSPNIVMKTSEVVLNPGEGVNGFNYKYYFNDVEMWNEDCNVIKDTSYLNTEITVDKYGVIRSKLIVESQSQNEPDVFSVVTPYVDENYEFDSLSVNGVELAPGDSIIVQEDMTYYGQLNFKYVEPPAPPTPPDPPNPPTPSDPGTGSQIVNAQTGDFNWFTIAGLAFAFAVIAFTLFASRKQTY